MSLSEAAFCRGTIATCKIPQYWKTVNGFPMTVTGNVQKYRMRKISTGELVGADPEGGRQP